MPDEVLKVFRGESTPLSREGEGAQSGRYDRYRKTPGTPKPVPCAPGRRRPRGFYRPATRRWNSRRGPNEKPLGKSFRPPENYRPGPRWGAGAATARTPRGPD